MNKLTNFHLADSALREKATVLVVDDTDINREILREVLSPQYNIREADSGAAALTGAVAEPKPDVILLDIMMLAMDGYQVIERLKANPVTADIPVIFITAMTGTDDELHGLALGAVDYIVKPFSAPVVQARVATHVELKRARDRLSRENDWLEHEVHRRMGENALIQNLAIRALACIGDARDNDTGHHIARTRAYVDLLANALADHPRFKSALGNDRLRLVVNAAPLHDIGKVGIPDAILLKPGKLSPEEFEIMKRHTVIGAEAIVKAMSQALAGAELEIAHQAGGAFAFLEVAREICLSHHERWDGQGYPAGLAGDDIPAAARLMTLADVFDALVSRRVYKSGMPFDDACRLISSGRGSQFDPAVVDAFLALREQFMLVANQFSDAPLVSGEAQYCLPTQAWPSGMAANG